MNDCDNTTERILLNSAEAEYVEKKSRFIATLVPVGSEDEALEKVEEIRKKYYDARHNCYAYIVYNDERTEVVSRSSDDGEPSGTAGRPMLEVLDGNGIRNVLAVVTRYFGGTLLGTGGLVRAYRAAVKNAVEEITKNEDLINVISGVLIQLNTDYTNLATVQHHMRECHATEVTSTYEDDVILEMVIPDEYYERFIEGLTHIFAGKEQSERIGTVRYGIREGRAWII